MADPTVANTATPPADQAAGQKTIVASTLTGLGTAAAAFAAAFGLQDGFQTYPFMAVTFLLVFGGLAIAVVAMVREQPDKRHAFILAGAILVLALLAGTAALIGGPQKVKVVVKVEPVMDANIKLAGRSLNWAGDTQYLSAGPFTLDLADLKAKYDERLQDTYRDGFFKAMDSKFCERVGLLPAGG